jgi:hypothetical protein
MTSCGPISIADLGGSNRILHLDVISIHVVRMPLNFA